MKTTFSSVFEDDFAEVVTRYAGEMSVALSVRFEMRIAEALELIARQLEIGRRRKDLQQPGIRSFRVRGFDSHLIFYQLRKEDVFIVRLLHGAMDLPAMFPEA